MFTIKTTNGIDALKWFAAAGGACGAMAPDFLVQGKAFEHFETLCKIEEESPKIALLLVAHEADEAALFDEAARDGQGLCTMLHITRREDRWPSATESMEGGWEPRPREDEIQVASPTNGGGKWLFASLPPEGLTAGWGRSFARLIPPEKWGEEWTLIIGTSPGGEASEMRRLVAALAAGATLPREGAPERAVMLLDCPEEVRYYLMEWAVGLESWERSVATIYANIGDDLTRLGLKELRKEFHWILDVSPEGFSSDVQLREALDAIKAQKLVNRKAQWQADCDHLEACIATEEVAGESEIKNAQMELRWAIEAVRNGPPK